MANEAKKENNKSQNNVDNSKPNNGEEKRILPDIGDNSKAIAYAEMADIMTEILHSPLEEGKRQLTMTVCMFKLPEIFTFDAVANVFTLEKEAKTNARHALMKGLCREYGDMLDNQKAYAALERKYKTEDETRKYNERKLSLDAMDKMVTLSFKCIYFLRHKETPEIRSIELTEKGKRTLATLSLVKSRKTMADGTVEVDTETKVLNASELTRLGVNLLPKAKRNTNGKEGEKVEAKPIADSLPVITQWLGAQAATILPEQGLEDMPESIKLSIRDMLKTYLPLEFADRQEQTFDGNAFAKYVDEVLKLKFEYTPKPVRKTNPAKNAA